VSHRINDVGTLAVYEWAVTFGTLSRGLMEEGRSPLRPLLHHHHQPELVGYVAVPVSVRQAVLLSSPKP